MPAEIKIGLAERTITPALGVPMAGYGARKGTAEGVHDDLHVRALVVEGEPDSVAIVSASVIGLPQDVIDDVRCRIAGKTGLPGQNIMLAATHTHSGPTVTDAYKSVLADGMVAALIRAWETRGPGRLGMGVTTVEDVARNRRRLDYGGLPVDPEVGVLRVEDEDGHTMGVLFHYACHPTTMGPRSLLISEDWVYYAIQRVKQQTGHDAIVMFLNGAEGDLNPGYSAGLSAVAAEIPIRTWEFAEKLGNRVGDAVSDALLTTETRSACSVRSVTSRLRLPFRGTFPMTVAEAEAEVEVAQARVALLEAQDGPPPRTLLDRARMNVFFAEMMAGGARWFVSEDREESVDVELQSILLDDAAFSSFPGEVFVEVGLAAKARSPFSKTFPVGLANAGRTGGYLPTREAFAEGDYEVYASNYREDAADILVDATVAQLKSLVAT